MSSDKEMSNHTDELEEVTIEGEVSKDGEEVDTDPYKIKNVDYLKPSKEYKDKRKVLVFANRRISQLGLSLMKDLKALLPHHKSEAKWENKMNYEEINEICELNRCTSAIYLESRKSEMIMWIAITPEGPTLKSRVTNIHTLKDSTFLGNCLARSRPLLTFDRSFGDVPHLKLIQRMLSMAMATPRNHPKSMPFHDHCLSFFYFKDHIIVRHYQISPNNEFYINNPDNQTLTEIGPQFVLEPILILEGSFKGITLWRNSKYISPMMVRRYKHSLKMEKRRKKKVKKVMVDLPEDELSISNVFATPSHS